MKSIPLIIVCFLANLHVVMAQVVLPSTPAGRCLIGRYVESQFQSNRSHDYFYTLYSRGTFRNLGPSDSVIIRRYLIHPNAFSNQYAHFLADYRQLPELKSRSYPLLFHGFLPGASGLRRSNLLMKRWHERESIKIRNHGPRQSIPSYCTGVRYGASSNFRGSFTQNYFTWASRYNRMYEIMDNDRSRR